MYKELVSPFHDLRELCDRFRTGDLDQDDFLAALDDYDERLQEIYTGLAPEGDDEEAVDEEAAISLETIQLFTDASEQLRTFADNGDEEMVTEALELARTAHERFVELVETRGDVVELLEEISYRSTAPTSEEYWG